MARYAAWLVDATDSTRRDSCSMPSATLCAYSINIIQDGVTALISTDIAHAPDNRPVKGE
jgi:hypothetical protein